MILAEFAKIPNFLGYSEDMNSAKQPAKLLLHGPLFMALQRVDEKLTFTQKTLEQALVITHEACAAKWGRTMTKPQLQSWSTSLAKQLRTACRHINQSLKTAWVRKLLSMPDVAVEDVAEEDAVEEGAEEEKDFEADQAEDEPCTPNNPIRQCLGKIMFRKASIDPKVRPSALGAEAGPSD